VRGFAVTLLIGILTSMFTAVYVTRLIIELWMAWRRPKTIVV
jgi:preprotein translocase subunit SecD